MKLQRIALFISGNGSNARNITDFFHQHNEIQVCLMVSSAPNERMKEYCEERSISFEMISQVDDEAYLSICQQLQIDWIILAGFLKKIPATVIQQFQNRIINIHPALLPRFGGKGMYGKHVHEAVSQSHVAFSGITIHLVNEEFDKGKMLAQFATSLPYSRSAKEIEEVVRALEIKHFPSVIEAVILQ